MGLTYYQVKPSGELSAYVQFFWIGEVRASMEHSFTHRVIATRSPKLVFHYQGRFAEVTATGALKPSFSSGLQGPSKTHARFVAREETGIFGIEFFPWAIPALFSLPAAALTNQYVDLKSLLGHRGQELEEKIFAAATGQERVHIATSFLRTLTNRPLPPTVTAAVQLIDRSKGLMDTDTLLKKTAVSQRQLERLFKEFVGLSPRQYARVTRFETAVGNFRKKVSFTEIALDAGYFDQAHFNHEFLEFTGLHPKGYLAAIDKLPIPAC